MMSTALVRPLPILLLAVQLCACAETSRAPVSSYPGPATPWRGAAAPDQAGSYEPSAAPATADVRVSSREAPAPREPGALRPQPPAEERPGLGTVFGEERYSPVRDVDFMRAGDAPAYVASIYYNDRQGTEAMRVRAGRLVPCGDAEPLFHAYRGGLPLFGGVVIRVIDEYGLSLPAYHVADRVLVIGEAGRRYALRIENRTGQRIEVVASVDGLDVVDGKTAGFAKRGYVVPAHGHVDIDGYRRTLAQVAAFRFGSVRDSYAAKSSDTGDRHVGIIGVALFTEQGDPWPDLDAEAQRREQADPFPGRFAQPPME